MNVKTFHYRVRRLCAFIIGVVFLLAGIFKLLDPVGAGLVMEEYFKFFHVSFLDFGAKALAVTFALVEALLGAAMICGLWRKIVAIVTTAMIVFFTVLTLVLAIVNPPMDCGCFGEVVHLSNLQTFLKNIVLLALSMIAFLPFKNFGRNKKRKYVSFSVVAVAIVAFMCYSLVSIPLVDYTAFAPGSELLSSESDSETEPDEDDYISTFIYEKNGQQGAFSLDRLPDSTWTFVRTETILRNGPDIKNREPLLSFTDSSGVYQDEKASEGNVLVVSVYNPRKVKGEAWTKIAGVLSGASSAGFNPLLLVAATKKGFDSLPVIVPEVRSRLTGVTFFADRKTLLSLNRSNGGSVWFNDGELIQKNSFRKLPSESRLMELSGDDATEAMLHSSTKGRLCFQGFLLYVFAILLIL